MRLFAAVFCALNSFVIGVDGQIPEWIWSDSGAAPAGETRFFRKEFTVGFEAREAKLVATGDDEITIFINGVQAGRSTHWKEPISADIAAHMRIGTNVLAARARNGAAGLAAVLVKLEVRSPNMSGQFVLSDGTWRWSPEEIAGWQEPGFAATSWTRARSLGKLGVAPWGEVFKAPTATPADSLTVLPGFKAELLKSAAHSEGSWICMTFDDRGRIIVSPEKNEAPMLRLTLDERGQVSRTEVMPSPLRGAMGLLYAHDSLYVNGRGPKGVGLYRLIDSNRNDQFDPGEERLLKNFDGDNEHGYHAVVLGPDGAIYVMNGNHTKVPPGVDTESPYKNYAEDLLLPRLWDANGHAKGVLAPGGYILRTDPEGREWRLICGGFRNTYDFDFAPNGEMFTFDSDMEWDVGAPWYRPTRILHCVSGGEYGWRSGTGKWPEYYADSLPGVVDTGLSSPTGVKFGTHSKFPEKYRRAFFAQDWAYGKVFAVHLQAQGATYRGTFETFISGKPLAVVDLEFGPDGAMYFITGGWKIQSGLYRVSWTGAPGEQDTGSASTAAGAEIVPREIAIRRELETFQGKHVPRALEIAWPYLASDDRWLRFAARVAVESQPVAEWQERALSETNVNAAWAALVALARSGSSNAQPALVDRACTLLETRSSEEQALDGLRALQLAFIRMGRPDSATGARAIDTLSRLYPARSEKLNSELSQLLVFLEADVLGKTLSLLNSAATQEQQMHYAFVLRNVKRGWTPDQRRAYFAWFQTALLDYRGGASFRPFLINIRNEAAGSLTAAERAELGPLLDDPKPVTVAVAPREFVKEWKIEELEPALNAADTPRSFRRGKEAFVAAQCVACHRVGADGGAAGPDLTGVSGRFGRREILDHILSPSKIISDRYQSYSITKRDGEEINGCVTEETDEKLVVMVDPMTNARAEVAKKDIVERSTSKLSLMPEGLLNVLTREEILDLLAFLEADGKPDAALFAR